MLTLAAAILIALLVALAVVFGARWWTWRPVVTRRVLVHLDTGLTISGVVMARRGPLLVLGDATVHLSGDQKTSADGSVVIERPRVVWMQVV